MIVGVCPPKDMVEVGVRLLGGGYYVFERLLVRALMVVELEAQVILV